MEREFLRNRIKALENEIRYDDYAKEHLNDEIRAKIELLEKLYDALYL